MNEEDKKKILEDFKKANLEKKMDMWFYAIEQESLWEEIMDQMSKIARVKILKESGGKTIIAEE
jgi:hypothetical protein